MVAVQPPPLRVPIVEPNTGRPTFAFRDYLIRVLKRVGGAGDKTLLVLGGAGASTDNGVVRFDGVTGAGFQDSGVTIDDSDNVDVPGTLNVTGAVTVSSTVDGRDVAADGSKLDAIEAGAEVNEITGFGAIQVFETTVGQAALASAGTVTLLTSTAAQQWKVREIYLSGDGTDFSGGGGDRLLDITDGSSAWTTIPAATLQSLAIARWFDTGVPAPATASHFTTASTAGDNIVAQYSGGTTDYTAGSLTIVLIAERVA